MKQFYLILFSVLLCSCISQAQPNLVPNGDFEDYTTCPLASAQVTRCTGWKSWTNASPDYCNACSNGNVGVPANVFGYQAAYSGNAYVGVASSIAAKGSIFKEYLTRDITPMETGYLYEISLSLNLAENISTIATDDIGVFFYDNGPGFYPTSSKLPLIPQIEWPGKVINDVNNWVRMKKVFFADSAYDNIAIGGFGNAESHTIIPPVQTGQAYYFIDDMVVRLYDSLHFEITDTAFCAGDKMSIKYYTTKKKRPNNVFRLQLSDASGSFISATDIGMQSNDTSGIMSVSIPANIPIGTGYKLRLVASDYADTSNESDGISITIATVSKPVSSSNSPVCSIDTLKLSAVSTTSGVSYLWIGPGFKSLVQNPTIPNPLPAGSGSYIVAAYIGGCKAFDTINVNIYPGNGPVGTIATTNAPICEGDTLKLLGTSGSSAISFAWSGPGNFSASSKDTTLTIATLNLSGNYILSATDGACTSKDTVTVLVKPQPQNFTSSVNSPVCEGDTLEFVSSAASTLTTFRWLGPDGFNFPGPITSIPTATPANSGEYDIIATLDGCSVAATLNVVVNPYPAAFKATVNSPICAGEPLTLSATSSTPGVEYSWQGPDGDNAPVPTWQIINAKPAMSGKYVVTADNKGCKSYDSVMAVIKPNPAVVSPANNGPVNEGESLEISVDSSTPGVKYNWYGPNGFNSLLQNNVIPKPTKAATGWYVLNIDLDGCGFSDSTYAEVKELLKQEEGLILYPNPNNGRFMISGNVNTNDYLLLTVTNILEQEIYREGLQPDNNHIHHSIDISRIASGVYLLNVMTAKKIIRIEFVVL